MLYTDYLKEREGGHVFEVPNQGFATYFLNGKECYIRDIYVAPDYRRSKVATFMLDCIVTAAKKAGCTFITGTVMPTAPGATESMKASLVYGFQLVSSNSQLIYLKKDI